MKTRICLARIVLPIDVALVVGGIALHSWLLATLGALSGVCALVYLRRTQDGCAS